MKIQKRPWTKGEYLQTLFKHCIAVLNYIWGKRGLYYEKRGLYMVEGKYGGEIILHFDIQGKRFSW